MDERRKAVRELVDRIRSVLLTEWAPILADVPEDEYDQYADRLASLLLRGATDGELTAYFEWAEIENMGLGGPFALDRASKVISLLRALELP
jgi:hypothetical protein